MQLNELAGVIDQYYMRREERLALDRQSEEVAVVERELKQLIMAHMEEQHVHTAGSANCTVKLKITPKPTAADWSKIWEYVKAHDAPELYYRRLNEKAVMERQEQGEEIPGIEMFPVASLSVSRGKS